MSKERDAWRELPARQRAGIAVSGNKHMATLFAHLMNAKLCNMSGSAYRCHPQCIFRNGILITDHWKTWGEYDIKIANDPSQQPARGCQDSMSRGGDPYPKIESGWTSVWARGQWLKEGPWQDRIRDVLTELTEAADRHYAEEAASQQAAREAYDLEKQRKDQELLSAWGSL